MLYWTLVFPLIAIISSGVGLLLIIVIILLLLGHS